MARKKRTTKKASNAIQDMWIEGIATATAETRPYSMKTKFEVGDVIDHKVFGRGVVKSFLSNEKIEVVFEETIKTLIHDKR
ncbi:MAG: hypothetical protein H6621_04070 [Halobacteriovoraceae bacterium]|nr:hypothetical protein [Halobacteriovoraceae bacterium]MCB9094226.1 hypothetical protein [Halobacteriovoraceae bacterium]